MNQRFISVGFVLVLGLAACSKDVPKDDTKQLEGDWVAVAISEKGKKIGEPAANAVSVSINSGKYFRIDAGGGKVVNHGECSIRANFEVTPAEVDVVHLNGTDVGKTQPGIVEINGDKMTLCLADVGSTRPAEFTEKGTVSLLLLKRK